MKTFVVRHKKSGDIKTFKYVYESRCLINCLTGEESYLVLIFRNRLELKLDLTCWEIAIECGEPEDFEDLSDPEHFKPFQDQFDILIRIAYSLKSADLTSLSELLQYDPDQLSSDLDFLADYSTIPFSSDDLPF